ncbi:MAG: hypothetical protein WAU47_00940 [Desulfobaccales bacterium]
MRSAPSPLALLLVGLFLLCACGPAFAGDWSVVPQVDLGAKYDSNINFNYIGKQSDFIFNLAPSVDFNYTSETSKLTGRLGLDGLVYVKDPSLDTINQYYSVFGQKKVAPRLALNLTGGYTLDSTLNEELISSGFIMNRTRRQALEAAPGLEFNLSERALLRAGYRFNRVNYQDPSYVNYSQHTVNLGLNYLLKNAKTTVMGTVLGRYIDYPQIGNAYRNVGTYLGVDHKFTEDWTLSLFTGLNYNWFTSQTAVLDFGNFTSFIRIRQAKLETFSVTPYFDISANRKWTRTNWNFGYRLDQSASGSGTVNQFHNGYAGITRNITERLTGTLRGNLYYSLSDSPGSDYNNLVLYVTPELNYKLTEKFTLNSSYTYGWRDDLVVNQTTSRNLVWLYLRYSNTLHYQK